MNIKSHSELRELIHNHFDINFMFHRFEDCYSFDGKSSVMLFSVYLPNKSKLPVLKAFPHFGIFTDLNVLESKIPNQYYVEFIYLNL